VCVRARACSLGVHAIHHTYAAQHLHESFVALDLAWTSPFYTKWRCLSVRSYCSFKYPYAYTYDLQMIRRQVIDVSMHYMNRLVHMPCGIPLVVPETVSLLIYNLCACGKLGWVVCKPLGGCGCAR